MSGTHRPPAGFAFFLVLFGPSAAISRQGRLRALQHASQTPAPLLVPQPNDTIPQTYWDAVDQAILLAGRSTTKPASYNDPGSTAPPSGWDKLLDVTTDVVVLDTPDAELGLNDWRSVKPVAEGSSPQGPSIGATKASVLPYDMALGARLLSGATVKGPSAALPKQDFIDQQFVAQCPLVIVGKSLEVRAPSCGSNFGSWIDSGTDRTVMRWQPSSSSGLGLAVDSVVSGLGSVTFGAIDELLSLGNRYTFQIKSCLGVAIYLLEESIIKVDQMAQHAESTMVQHEIGRAGVAFFYQYSVRNLNGSLVAQTNLFRMDSNQVQFSARSDGMAAGAPVAVAQRQGSWTREKWRECIKTPRAWKLDFSNEAGAGASIKDLRMVAAATMTLIALRDEQLDTDGLQTGADTNLYLSLAKSGLIIAFVIGLAVICLMVFKTQGVDQKMRRFCFRFEAVMLPKRPAITRTPPLNPTY